MEGLRTDSSWKKKHCITKTATTDFRVINGCGFKKPMRSFYNQIRFEKMTQSSVSSPSYLCINCKYVCWSGKGPFRCLSPSLLSPVEDWPC